MGLNDPRSGVRAVRHDETGGHGHGAGHLPIDRRGSRRQLSAGRNAALARRSRSRCHSAGCIAMTGDRPVVFVVDDDARVRDALSSLLASAGPRWPCLPRQPSSCGRQAGRARVPGSGPGIAGHPWARPAEGARGTRGAADRVHYGAWRCSLVGKGDEGGRRRVPVEAIRRRGAVPRDRCGDRARSGGAAEAIRAAELAAATSGSHLASVKCSPSSSPASPTS